MAHFGLGGKRPAETLPPPLESGSEDLTGEGWEHISAPEGIKKGFQAGWRSITSITSFSRSNDILIAVMGMTGVGKTSFIQDMTGQKLKVGHDLESCTKEIEVVTTEIQGRKVHFIDTPGFDDTKLTDSDILLTIANYLDGSKGSIRLTGLLYLHRITDPRVGNTAMKNLRMFRKLVGDNNMRNVMLVTTGWDNVAPEDGERRREQLKSTSNFWGDLIRLGASCWDYRQRPEDGSRIVAEVMKNNPRAIKIQEELQQGTKLQDTSAGKEVTEAMEKLAADYERRLKEMKAEMEIAQKERDDLLTDMLKQHYEKALADQKAAAEAKERFYKGQIEKLEARIENIEKNQGGGGCIII